MATNTASSGSAGKLTTALVLGIIGGVFGIIGAILWMLFGGLGAALAAEGAGVAIGGGFLAVFIGVAGIVGGALSRAASKTAALLMLLTGIGGFIAAQLAWLIAGPLLIAGAVLAWLGRSREAAQPRAATA